MTSNPNVGFWLLGLLLLFNLGSCQGFLELWNFFLFLFLCFIFSFCPWCQAQRSAYLGHLASVGLEGCGLVKRLFCLVPCGCSTVSGVVSLVLLCSHLQFVSKLGCKPVHNNTVNCLRRCKGRLVSQILAATTMKLNFLLLLCLSIWSFWTMSA